MYLEYFGLTAQPFRLTPDAGFLFMSEPHSRAKSYMDYTVWNREGFAVITGEIGCGKTTLIQKLLSELDEHVVVAKVFQTQLDEVEFLQAVLLGFGLNPPEAGKSALLDLLNQFLIAQFLQHKQIVLVVDEAHNLSGKVLEEIRALSELETRKEKILHVILVGQPQLNEVLDDPEMVRLMQRVKLRYHLRALSEKEHADYIRHRLSIAGASNRTLFPPETLPLIYRYTGGIPRLINALCDTVLSCACADSLPEITAEVVEAAAKELRWLPYAQRADKRRPEAARGPLEDGVQAVLREHAQALAALAAQVGKLEGLSPALESIGRRLEAIEAQLRTLTQGHGAQPRPDSSAGRRQKSG
ncbi:MAG: AAA family ATPase [Burkholderiales bacterium]